MFDEATENAIWMFLEELLSRTLGRTTLDFLFVLGQLCDVLIEAVLNVSA